MSINATEEVITKLKGQIADLQARQWGLTQMMGVATVGLCCLDTNFRYTYINDWLAELNGLPAKDHIGRSIRELFPELAGFVEPQFQQVIDTGIPIIKGRVLAETPARPGVKRLFEHNYYQEKQPDGTVSGICCFVEEITEREEAEVTTQESIKRYEHLFSNMTEGMALSEIICDESGAPIDYRFLAINPAFERLTGFKAEDLIGKRAYEVIPDLEPHWLERYGPVALTGKPAHYEEYNALLKKHFKITVYRPAEGQFACIFEDITDRERAWEELKESEQKFRTFVDSVKAVPWRFDLKEDQFTLMGKQVEELFGYPVSHWVDFNSWSSSIHTDDRDEAVEFCTSSTAKGLDHDFEYRCVTADGRIIWIRDIVTLRKDDTGTPVELIGYMIDITERKRAEEKTLGLAQIIEKSLNEIYVFDAETFKFVQVNHGARENIGYTSEELSELTPFDIKPLITKESFARLIEPLKVGAEEIITFETLHERKNGSRYDVEIHLQLSEWDYKTVFVAIILDITERKRAEQAMQASEKRFRTIYENAPVLIDAFDEKGGCVLWNNECRKVFGWTIDEINAHGDALALFYPDPAIREEVMKTVTTTPDGHFKEWHPITKDGKTLTTMWANFRLPDGMTFNLGYDITESRRAEEALKESEEKYRTLTESNPYGFQVIDVEGNIKYTNPAYQRMLGYTEGELLEKTIFDLLDTDEARASLRDYLPLLIKDRPDPTTYEQSNRTKDGEIIDQLVDWDYRLDIDGRVIGFASIITDVTERKQAEQALRDSEEKYRTLTEANPYGFDVIDADGNITYSNPAYQKMVGYTEEELLGKSVFDLLDTDEAREELRAYLPMLVKDKPEPTTYEQKTRTKDGGIIDQLVDWNYNLDSDGRVIGFASVITDVTERNRLEDEVSKYHEHLEALVLERTAKLKTRDLSSELEHQLLNYIVSAENIEQALKMCLIELSEFLEYEHAEIWVPQEDNNCLKALYHWSSEAKDLKLITECSIGLSLEKGQDVAGRVWSTEKLEWSSIDLKKIGRANPRYKEFDRLGIKSVLGVPVKTNSALLAVFCFYSSNEKAPSDEATELISAITLQVALAIDRLHVASAFEIIKESTPVAMLVTSESGKIIFQNGACSKLFGYSEVELLGKPVEVLIPESLHSKHRMQRKTVEKRKLPRSLGSGLKILGRKKDGTEIPIDVSLNLQETVYGTRVIVGIIDLREHQKNIDALSASRQRLRDLTNHMTRITERERKAIARDLHDDLGQVLTSLKIDISILGRKLGASGDFRDTGTVYEDLAAMSDTLESASGRLHGFISRLRPEVLDNLGLITALEWQTEEFSSRSSIKCNFVSTMDTITVDDEAAIAIFRIIQECLTNIARHSKANNATVQIDRANGSLVVEVSDDGIGISSEIIASTKRFGLLGVKERASALQGNVQIESTPGKGTMVRTTIPFEPEGENSD